MYSGDDETDPTPFPELKSNDRTETDVVKQQKKIAYGNVINQIISLVFESMELSRRFDPEKSKKIILLLIYVYVLDHD